MPPQLKLTLSSMLNIIMQQKIKTFKRIENANYSTFMPHTEIKLSYPTHNSESVRKTEIDK